MTEAVDLTEFRDRPVKPCAIGRLLIELPEDDRIKLAAALTATDITHLSIVRWINKHGKRTTDTTVATHRSGRCSCA